MPQQMTETGSPERWPETSSSNAGSNSSGDSPPMPLSLLFSPMTEPPAPITQTRMFDVPQSTAIHSARPFVMAIP